MEIGGLLVGLVAGLFVGGIGVYLWRRETGDTVKQLEETRCEMKAYRQEVTDHYLKTADLVDRLTQDYKSLFEHLNEGAMKQMEPDVLQQKLAQRTAAPVVLGILGREGLPAPSETPPSPSNAPVSEGPREEAVAASDSHTPAENPAHDENTPRDEGHSPAAEEQPDSAQSDDPVASDTASDDEAKADNSGATYDTSAAKRY